MGAVAKAAEAAQEVFLLDQAPVFLFKPIQLLWAGAAEEVRGQSQAMVEPLLLMVLLLLVEVAVAKAMVLRINRDKMEALEEAGAHLLQKILQEQELQDKVMQEELELKQVQEIKAAEAAALELLEAME